MELGSIEVGVGSRGLGGGAVAAVTDGVGRHGGGDMEMGLRSVKWMGTGMLGRAKEAGWGGSRDLRAGLMRQVGDSPSPQVTNLRGQEGGWARNLGVGLGGLGDRVGLGRPMEGGTWGRAKGTGVGLERQVGI